MNNTHIEKIRIPKDPDQWYNRLNHMLLYGEVEEMRKKLPNAEFSFMQSTGNMYWIAAIKVFGNKQIKELPDKWKFIFEYAKDHPNNEDVGGSVKIIPIKPSDADLKKIAKQYGRPGVPHLLRDETYGVHLCTRGTTEVHDGERISNSAVSSVAWAVDWAAHYILSLTDDRLWNQWCDDKHFWKWKTCYGSINHCRNKGDFFYSCENCSLRRK